MQEVERSELGNISRLPLTGQAYEIIKEAIVSLRLKPGSRLKESMLAEELGISTTPIKVALAQLEREGLVKVTRFKGASVAEINDRDVEEIFELREFLEGAAVKRAATTFTSEDLEKGEVLLRKMSGAYNAGDMGLYTQASRDFHDLFIEKLRNQRMVSVFKNFDDHLERVRLTAIRTPENIPLFIEDYSELLEAVKAKNPGKAEKALVSHLKRVKNSFYKAKDKKEANL